MNMSVIISLAGVFCTIFGTWAGYRNGIRKDAGKEGTLRSDIGYIKSSVDDLKGEQRNCNQLHYSLAERVGRVEESAKSAHRRIDGIEEKIR